jgi:hypothetical protein
MPIAIPLIGAAATLGGAAIASSSASKARKAQENAAAQQLAAQQAKDAQTRADFAPYREAGASALGMQGGLLGLNGFGAQQEAIGNLQQSPLYQSIYRNGQEAVLQNASATGGLRGGNTQRSLADFGADTLAQVIQAQLANLGGISQLGAGVTQAGGALGQANVNQQSAAMGARGDAAASGALAQGGIWSNALRGLGGIAGGLIGGAGGGGFSPSIVPSFAPSVSGSGAWSLGGSGYRAPGGF